MQSVYFKSLVLLLWSCTPLYPSKVCNHSENFLPWNNDADSEERNELLWIRICKAQLLSLEVWNFGEQNYITLLTRFSSQANELVNEDWEKNIRIDAFEMFTFSRWRFVCQVQELLRSKKRKFRFIAENSYFLFLCGEFEYFR